MYKLVIQGGIPLSGNIKTSGSKNATLPIFFASILADGPLKLANTPQLSDVSTTLRLLMEMGSNFVLEEDGSIFIDSSSLTKKKIVPYIDFEYSAELALGKYWEQLQPMDKKVFERDIKTTLINEYISSLVNLEDWNQVNITVDNNFSQVNNLAEVKIVSTLENENISAIVTLKLIRKDRWRVYDLVYQSFSILDYFEYSYNEKIRRAGGLKNTLRNMLQRT